MDKLSGMLPFLAAIAGPWPRQPRRRRRRTAGRTKSRRARRGRFELLRYQHDRLELLREERGMLLDELERERRERLEAQ